MAGPRWTIDALGAAVADALSDGYSGAPSGRVRDVPDRRTIRYYTTLGLIDRPAELRGRTALYGRRHLLQLVAIKRLQARGLSLAEVQAELTGASDAELERLAALHASVPPPEAQPEPRPEPGPEPAPRGARARGVFWGVMPADAPAARADTVLAPPPPASGGTAVQAGWRAEERLSGGTGGDAEAPGKALRGLRLGPDVFLVLAAERTIEAEDTRAVEAAARALLAVLEERGLVRASRESRG